MKGGNKDTDVNLSKAVDIIAAKLITNDSYLDLEKLKDQKYCDKLIIMTTKVLKKFFNTLEIEFLEQNPEARIQILTDLRERWITESVKDGTEVYNILNKFVDQLGLQLEPKIQEKGPSGLELFF